MIRDFTESTIDEAALAWLEAAGWRMAHGPEIAPDTPAAERADYAEMVLAQPMHGPLARLNPAHRESCLIIHGVNDCHSHRG